MCKKCDATLGGVVRPHAEADCPLIMALYCGVCGVRGHSPAQCRDMTTRAYRKAQFVEQLIPWTALEEYGIASRTPLGPALTPEPQAAALSASLNAPPAATLNAPLMPPMRVPETVDGLRAALVSIDVKPKLCQLTNGAQEIKANKVKLEAAAKELGRTVVIERPLDPLPCQVPPPTEKPEKPEPPKKSRPQLKKHMKKQDDQALAAHQATAHQAVTTQQASAPVAAH